MKFMKMAGFLAATASVMMIGAGVASAETEGGEPISVCIITSSGIDDGSFNQDCYKGILSFIDEHDDCTVTDIKESDYNELIPTVEKSVGDYDVFVLPGFNFAGIGDIAQNNPDKDFIVVDSTITDSEGNALTLDNVYTMTFKEQEGGFLAGVAAALSTKSDKVAVVNGMPFPSNVNYELGFMSGVAYANENYGTAAECIELPSYAGTDLFGNEVGGNYTGDFTDEAQGKVVGEALIDEGCDVIFVAAGASGNGVFTAAKEADDVYVIGCDVDQFDDGVNGSGNIILTSSLKVMHSNVKLQLENIYNGTFSGQDAILGADTDSTGIVTEEGRQQLDDGVIEKLDECYELIKSGDIVPASQEDFQGLK
ncbi:MAG: BMP family ABC transporter substrate-binding protein [Lachnospiraceae bacterium]|nr:BMP family ABC transporter substrate-binding protein [Lachnospiraceae bacterium]